MSYLKSIIEKYPPYKTAEEEMSMIKAKLKKNDVKGMQDELVLRNVGLIPLIGKSWSSFYTEDELVSYGIEGLTHAAHTFDYTKGYRFSTYASKGIRTWLQRNKKKKLNVIDEKSVSLDEIIDGKDKTYTRNDIVEKDVSDEYRTVKNTMTYVLNKDTQDFFFSLINGSKLNSEQKEVVIMRFIKGYETKEIAEKRNIKIKRVQTIIGKAMAKIRREIMKGHCGKIFGIKEPKIEHFRQEHTYTYHTWKNGQYITNTDFLYFDYDWDSYNRANAKYRKDVVAKMKEFLKR
jgi:RNA polymerase sporulation-specific sigma factor